VWATLTHRPEVNQAFKDIAWKAQLRLHGRYRRHRNSDGGNAAPAPQQPQGFHPERKSAYHRVPEFGLSEKGKMAE